MEALSKTLKLPYIFFLKVQSSNLLQYRNDWILLTVITKRLNTGQRFDETLESKHVLRANFFSDELGCKFKDAVTFLGTHRVIALMNESKFKKLTSLFAVHGISYENLLTNPLVYSRKYETVQKRIEMLERGGVSQVKLSMINVTQKRYERRLKKIFLERRVLEKFGSMTGLIVAQFKCSTENAEKLVCYNRCLQTRHIGTIQKKIELLQSYDISSEAIMEKIWTVNYNYDILKDRLQRLTENGITYAKFEQPFFSSLRCSPERFEALLKNLVQEKEILGVCENRTQYLCKKLCCSSADVQRMDRKYHNLFSVNLFKLHNILNFLHECQYTTDDIINHSTIFATSEKTIQERFAEFQKLEMKPSLNQLMTSRKKFERAIRLLDRQAI